MASNSEGSKASQISAREALNVLPNTATVKDTAALDAYQEQETAAGNRPAPKKFYEHTDGETPFWKKAVIGGAVVALVVAGGLRLKKAADEGEITSTMPSTRSSGRAARSRASPRTPCIRARTA